jgi:hypothetical protein
VAAISVIAAASAIGIVFIAPPRHGARRLAERGHCAAQPVGLPGGTQAKAANAVNGCSPEMKGFAAAQRPQATNWAAARKDGAAQQAIAPCLWAVRAGNHDAVDAIFRKYLTFSLFGASASASGTPPTISCLLSRASRIDLVISMRRPS